MANLSASDLAGRHIRQARERRKWTAKDLAARCAEAGAPGITATVITNLETRRRASREITLEEVLVLAYVLDVPPLLLISPADGSETLQITPTVHMAAVEAASWIADDMHWEWSVFPHAGDGHDSLRANAVQFPKETSALTLLRHAGLAIAAIRRNNQLLPVLRQERPDLVADVVEQTRQVGLRLAQVNAWLEGLGFAPVEPPSDVAAILASEGLPDWRRLLARHPEITGGGWDSSLGVNWREFIEGE